MDKQTKVLVVDDEAAIRELLVDALTPQGYQVFTAADGLAAISVVEREDPDIAFVDIRMPGMSGLDLLRYLKEKAPKLQFVMITGHGSDEAVDSALQLSAFACLMKPFRMKDAIDIANIVQATS